MAYADRIPKAQQKKISDVKKIESQMADGLFESTKRIIGKNTFFITFGGSQVWSKVRCIGLCGRYFIAIDHYCHAMDRAAENGAEFNVVKPGLIARLPYRLVKWFKLENSAVVIGLLPKQYFNAFKDIRNFISKQKRLDNMSPTGFFIEPVFTDNISREQLGMWEMNIYHETIGVVNPQIKVPSVVDGLEPTVVNGVFEYGVCGKGKCGGILITDSNVNDPIIGIHIAGMTSGGLGYAEILTRESFDILSTDYYRQLDDGIQAESDEIMYKGEPIKPISVTNARVFIPYGVDVIGCVPKKFGHRSPTESTQIHTECYNQITTSTYDFPFLRKDDPRNVEKESPMLRGCMHHADPPESFYFAGIQLCYEDLRDKVLAKVKPCRRTVGVLSVEEAIVGIPHLEGYDAMEFDTSEGFPFISDRPKTASDKKWLFELDADESGYKLLNIDSRVVQMMQYKNDLRKQGIVPMTVFTDCLKDIKLPEEKLWPRIFSISPVDFTIQFRQYYMDFTIAYQKAMFDIESGVGINTDSDQWTTMVMKLLNNSDKFLCGDYSKFGPRLMSVCVYYAFLIILDWYEMYSKQSESVRLIRLVMGYEIMYAVHLMYNFLYRVYCGAPSGSPITTILNTLVNSLYFRYCWWTIKPQINRKEVQFLSVCHYDQYVCSVFYGDDNITTIKEEVLDQFNGRVISQILSKYSINYGGIKKDGSIVKWSSIYDDETSFLKRRIKQHPYRQRMYIAAMEQRAIEEICNWTFKCKNVRSQSIVSCEAMLLSAYGQGDVYYSELRERVVKYWVKKGKTVCIPSWFEVDERNLGSANYIADNISHNYSVM